MNRSEKQKKTRSRVPRHPSKEKPFVPKSYIRNVSFLGVQILLLVFCAGRRFVGAPVSTFLAYPFVFCSPGPAVPYISLEKIGRVNSDLKNKNSEIPNGTTNQGGTVCCTKMYCLQQLPTHDSTTLVIHGETRNNAQPL